MPGCHVLSLPRLPQFVTTQNFRSLNESSCATSTVDVLLLFWAALLCAGVAVGIMRGVEWQAERVNRLHDQMDRQYYGSSK